MITPKLTAVMVAMTALIGSGPIAAFAQDATVGDQTNAAAVETGGNTVFNAASVEQNAANVFSQNAEAESGDAEGGDAEAEAEAEAETEVKAKKAKDIKTVAEAIAFAEGGDAESGDATAFNINTGDVTQSNDQDATVNQTNNVQDNDEVTITQANAATALGGITDITELIAPVDAVQ